MLARPKAIMFDVDLASTLRLKEALPGWRFETMNGATADSIARGWKPGSVDLLVLGILDDGAAALKLCRSLAFCTVLSEVDGQEPQHLARADGDCRRGMPRLDAPILFLVSSDQQSLSQFALECGAHRCLVRPLRIKNMTDMLARIHPGHEKTVRQMPRNSDSPSFNDRAF